MCGHKVNNGNISIYGVLSSSSSSSSSSTALRQTSTARATLGRRLIAANSLAKGAVAGLWYMRGCTVLAWQPLPHPATMYTLIGGAMGRFTCEPDMFKCYCFERVMSNVYSVPYITGIPTLTHV